MNETQTYRPFIKMHGLGNHFVIFDARNQDIVLSAEQVRHLADSKTGIGCNQLIVVRASDRCDAYMEIWNTDGTRSGACGNAARCVGDIILKESNKSAVLIDTDSGSIMATRSGDMISINMGPARTDWAAIPLASNMKTEALDITVGPLSAPGAVSMGNPHMVFVCDDAEAVDLSSIGPEMEHHPLFPERANVSIASLQGDHIRLRVWERGVGITQACGTAACAALVAANRKGLIGRSAIIRLDGGELIIEWLEDGSVLMTGPYSYVFTGEVLL